MDKAMFLGWDRRLDRFESVLFRDRIMQRRGNGFGVNDVKYDGDGHLATFAPTGSGKGTSVVIPNLCFYTGSCVVLDPKAENFYVTAEFRKNVLRQRIYVLDPFEMLNTTFLREMDLQRDTINPVEVKGDQSRAVDIPNSAMTLAELIAGDSQGKDPFWDLEAKKLLAGVIGYFLEKGGANEGLSDVINALHTDTGDSVRTKIQGMAQTDGRSVFVKQALRSYTEKQGQGELSGVLSVCQSYLGQFLSDQIKKFFSRTSLSVDSLISGEAFTLYICVPVQKLYSHPKVIRLLVGMLLGLILSRGVRVVPPTLFLLDECAQLGYLGELKTGVSILRGFGAKIWMFFQDLGQLTGIYGQDASNTIIENCGVIQYFGQSREGRELMFEGLFSGEAIHLIKKVGTGEQFVAMTKRKEFICRRANYLHDIPFRGRWKHNPYHFGK